MDVVILGIQGSGKGSVIFGLQSYLDFTLISVGQLLRDEVKTGSDLGKHIHKLQTNGNLVETHIVETILKEKLKNRQKLMISDGFPRNLEQAELLDKILRVDLIIYLKIPKDVAIERLLNRLTCSNCGYVTQTDKVKTYVCPVCAGKLDKRCDDTKSAILKRFKTFEEETLPLIDRYKNKASVVTIDANREIDKVVNDVLKVINEHNN